MDVERLMLHQGNDSWDGEMTYHGIIYLVEVDQKDNKTWEMEVLQKSGGCSFLGKFYTSIQPLHNSVHPTLEAALDAAADYIRGLFSDADLT